MTKNYKVWNAFRMKRIKDYHNLHLNCVVLLLADAFENSEILV